MMFQKIKTAKTILKSSKTAVESENIQKSINEIHIKFEIIKLETKQELHRCKENLCEKPSKWRH